jgi:hypothetical protein
VGRGAFIDDCFDARRHRRARSASPREPAQADDPRVQALLGLAAVLAVLAAAWWAADRATPNPGPLATGPKGGGWSSGPAVPGEWEATTVFTNRLVGVGPAVLDSVSPADPAKARGLVIRYAILGRTTHGAPGLIRGWPPDGDQMLPLQGAVVRPGHFAAIVVAVASRSLGHWHIGAFTVRYHVGLAHYEATFEQGIAIRVVPRCPVCTEYGQLAGRLG